MNWIPKRKGAYYCSSACGGRCTWEAYQQAKTEARKAIKILGAGWKARVFENMGWHWTVTRGPISVYNGYWVMISEDPQRADHGSCLWTYNTTTYHKDPRVAVRRAAKIMYSVMNRLAKVEKSVRVTIDQFNKKAGG